MEDVSKAVVMSVQVLMFVFALTIAAVTYYRLNSNIRDIISETEYSHRGDAIFGDNSGDTTRKIKRAEVVNAVINIRSGDTVWIDAYEFKGSGEDLIHYELNDYNKYNDFDLHYLLMNTVTQESFVYKLSSFSEDTLRYKKVGP